MVSMKKRLAIFCVTYNSYFELKVYLSSLDTAASKVSSLLNVDIFIVDNTEEGVQKVDYLDTFSHINCILIPFHENNGYFGGVKKGMEGVDVKIYDFVAITNVDLTVADDAFLNLVNINVDDNVGWIAPSIMSKKENRDRNPGVLSRYSRRKLLMLKFKFDYPIVDFIYNQTFYKRKRLRKKYSAMDIYAGHGSFILLTRAYFEKCGMIDYPVFLFGEELYLAEECRKHSLRVIYRPEICIYDSEHVSTSKLKKTLPFKKTFYYQCNSDAIDYILANYYN